MRVLIAEDDPVSRALLARILSTWGYEVVTARDGNEAWDELQRENAPSLVILDWMMPDVDGIEVCHRVRDLGSASPPYLILLSARDSKGDVVAGLDSGANDYVGKPFDREELRARLQVGRRFVELNQKLLEAQRSLELQARTDPLIGCLNRRAVLEHLGHETRRAKEGRIRVGVGMIDVDHFKRVNDTFGHAIGDEVLRQVCRRSLRALPDDAVLGRFGGEELLVIIPNSDENRTEAFLERIRQAISASPVRAAGHEITVTVSIGGTVGPARSADAAIRAADDALYRAKAEGRNRVVMAGSPGTAHLKESDRGPERAESRPTGTPSPLSHSTKQ